MNCVVQTEKEVVPSIEFRTSPVGFPMGVKQTLSGDVVSQLLWAL